MEEVSSLGLMVVSTMVNSLRTKGKEEAFILGQMEENTMENGKKVNKVESHNLLNRMVK